VVSFLGGIDGSVGAGLVGCPQLITLWWLMCIALFLHPLAFSSCAIYLPHYFRHSLGLAVHLGLARYPPPPLGITSFAPEQHGPTASSSGRDGRSIRVTSAFGHLSSKASTPDCFDVS
jgi:hypothetical protein